MILPVCLGIQAFKHDVDDFYLTLGAFTRQTAYESVTRPVIVLDSKLIKHYPATSMLISLSKQSFSLY